MPDYSAMNPPYHRKFRDSPRPRILITLTAGLKLDVTIQGTLISIFCFWYFPTSDSKVSGTKRYFFYPERNSTLSLEGPFTSREDLASQSKNRGGETNSWNTLDIIGTSSSYRKRLTMIFELTNLIFWFDKRVVWRWMHSVLKFSSVISTCFLHSVYCR